MRRQKGSCPIWYTLVFIKVTDLQCVAGDDKMCDGQLGACILKGRYRPSSISMDFALTNYPTNSTDIGNEFANKGTTRVFHNIAWETMKHHTNILHTQTHDRSLY